MNTILKYPMILLLPALIVRCGQNEKPFENKQPDAIDSTKTKRLLKTIIFFGNSLTAGYGLDPSRAIPGAYPAENRFDGSYL